MIRAKRGKEPKQSGKQEFSWSVFRIRGTPAAFVGIVQAPDEASAIKKAIEEYNITDPETRKRLIAQRRAT
jgi:hypothetical protein